MLYLYKNTNMSTFKKKDIKKYKFTEILDDVDNEVINEDGEEEIDELVNSRGGPISGDDVNVNNSEIKTAPQATSDEFNQAAIQPNRYLYNINGTGYSRGSRVTGEAVNKIAKDKLINLLEEIGIEEPIVDANNDGVEDISTLTPNVINKLENLINTVNVNNLTSAEIVIVINYILTKLTNNLESNDLKNIKNILNNA